MFRLAVKVISAALLVCSSTEALSGSPSLIRVGANRDPKTRNQKRARDLGRSMLRNLKEENEDMGNMSMSMPVAMEPQEDQLMLSEASITTMSMSMSMPDSSSLADFDFDVDQNTDVGLRDCSRSQESIVHIMVAADLERGVEKIPFRDLASAAKDSLGMIYSTCGAAGASDVGPPARKLQGEDGELVIGHGVMAYPSVESTCSPSSNNAGSCEVIVFRIPTYGNSNPDGPVSFAMEFVLTSVDDFHTRSHTMGIVGMRIMTDDELQSRVGGRNAEPDSEVEGETSAPKETPEDDIDNTDDQKPDRPETLSEWIGSHQGGFIVIILVVGGSIFILAVYLRFACCGRPSDVMKDDMSFDIETDANNGINDESDTISPASICTYRGDDAFSLAVFSNGGDCA